MHHWTHAFQNCTSNLAKRIARMTMLTSKNGTVPRLKCIVSCRAVVGVRRTFTSSRAAFCTPCVLRPNGVITERNSSMT